MIARKAKNNNEYPWQNWCRLCGKEDANCSVDIRNPKYSGSRKAALRNYFNVHMHGGSKLSSTVCNECFNLITNLHSFLKHVAKVHKLIKTLQSNESSTQLYAAAQLFGQNWCRLCAKEDADSSVDICNCENSVLWKSVIKQYFNVKIYKNVNALSSTVCKECFNLITNVHSFSKHVVKVHEFINTFRSDKSRRLSDAAARRQRFGLPVVTKHVREAGEPNAASNQKSVEQSIENFESINHFPDFPDYGYKKVCMRLASEIVSNLKLPAVEKKRCVRKKKKQKKPKRNAIRKKDLELPTVKNKSAVKRKKKQIKPKQRYAVHKVNSNKNDNKEESFLKGSEFIQNDNIEFNCVLVNPESAPIKAEICDEDEYNETQGNLINSITGLTDNDPLGADSTEHTPNEQNNHHIDITQMRKDTFVKCETCNKSLRSKASLRMHKIRVHDKNKIVCHQCGEHCLDLESLNAHMAMHNAMRKYRCVACNLPFERVTEYRTHLLAHLDLLPYCCNYCNRRFGIILTVKQHYRFMHRNEPSNKPFFHKIETPSMHELVKMVAERAKSDAHASRNETILP